MKQYFERFAHILVLAFIIAAIFAFVIIIDRASAAEAHTLLSPSTGSETDIIVVDYNDAGNDFYIHPVPPSCVGHTNNTGELCFNNAAPESDMPLSIMDFGMGTPLPDGTYTIIEILSGDCDDATFSECMAGDVWYQQFTITTESEGLVSAAGMGVAIQKINQATYDYFDVLFNKLLGFIMAVLVLIAVWIIGRKAIQYFK